MAEDVLFNPGNAIASNIDPAEIIRTAQLTSDKRTTNEKVVMVKDENGKHLLFEVGDKESDPKKGKHYKIEQEF
ncbi:hypothetical protein MOO44_00535 (plasmid) [Nicoliella spurrieriana]|uniref:Uncharacterized protein n=1 Tax=Nicoliella spurrieriana TaxID=2925830 RepID=A0A976RQU4_9LACO|nr:hypothetical protein [Nicoliella spurrieriana]UQS86163.1 hypothetical protein MOO44_00535 [Nicoliella spurrieriana]